MIFISRIVMCLFDVCQATQTTGGTVSKHVFSIKFYDEIKAKRLSSVSNYILILFALAL